MADLAEPDCSPMNVTPAVGMRWIPSGTFRMGDDNGYPEEAPAHNVNVSGFWIEEYADQTQPGIRVPRRVIKGAPISARRTTAGATVRQHGIRR